MPFEALCGPLSHLRPFAALCGSSRPTQPFAALCSPSGLFEGLPVVCGPSSPSRLFAARRSPLRLSSAFDSHLTALHSSSWLFAGPSRPFAALGGPLRLLQSFTARCGSSRPFAALCGSPQPLAALRGPLAAAPSHSLQPRPFAAATAIREFCVHLRPFTAFCGSSRPLLRSLRPFPASCGPLWHFAAVSRPFEPFAVFRRSHTTFLLFFGFSTAPLDSQEQDSTQDKASLVACLARPYEALLLTSGLQSGLTALAAESSAGSSQTNSCF